MSILFGLFGFIYLLLTAITFQFGLLDFFSLLSIGLMTYKPIKNIGFSFVFVAMICSIFIEQSRNIPLFQIADLNIYGSTGLSLMLFFAFGVAYQVFYLTGITLIKLKLLSNKLSYEPLYSLLIIIPILASIMFAN